jgi:hypothetical protein
MIFKITCVTPIQFHFVKSIQYSNCECLDAGVTATSGYCHLECNNYIWYIGIFSLFVLIHSTSEVGSMLLTLRCVHAKDKAMALGLIQFAIGLFGKLYFSFRDYLFFLIFDSI